MATSVKLAVPAPDMGEFRRWGRGSPVGRFLARLLFDEKAFAEAEPTLVCDIEPEVRLGNNKQLVDEAS